MARDSARFAQALPGVAARYTVGSMGLDEQLVLSNASAPSSFSYTIKASSGLSRAR